MRKKAALLLLVASLLACSNSVSRADWQRMSNDEKVIYVSSLMGAERVKDAKGGGGKRYDDTAEEYVARIDAAYARGDTRDPAAIFAEMGTGAVGISPAASHP